MCRGVTRLDGAWGKKQVWRPRVRTWGLSEANVLFWKKCVWHCCDLLVPSTDSAPSKLSPLPPRYVSGVTQKKLENVPKINKFSCPNVMNFYSMNICNFRTQYCMDLAQTANKGYWWHFTFLRVVFVPRLCLPHASFSAWTCACFLIIKLFRNSTSYFFKVR